MKETGQVTLRIERLLFQEEGEQIQGWPGGPSKVQGGSLPGAEPDRGDGQPRGPRCSSTLLCCQHLALYSE